jgi:hypothetical protein
MSVIRGVFRRRTIAPGHSPVPVKVPTRHALNTWGNLASFVVVSTIVATALILAR